MTQAHPYPIHMRVVWAVDPNERGDSALHHRARKILRRLLAASAASVVEPVYVFRLSTAVAAETGYSWRKELVEAAHGALRAFTRHARIPGMIEPRVIVSPSSSYRRAAGALAEYAADSGADLVVAQTHGRSGFNRLFLGSFAETLLLMARTPVLLVNPRTRIEKAFRRILFPTDFGRPAAGQFREVLALARRFGAKLTLFHAIETQQEAVLLSSMAGPAPILPTRPERADRARKRARQWIDLARRHGIDTDFVLRERSRSPGDDILASARRSGADLIAMQTNSGAVSAALLGSTTRHVLRKSPCPVWILKPSPRPAANAVDRSRPGTISRRMPWEIRA